MREDVQRLSAGAQRNRCRHREINTQTQQGPTQTSPSSRTGGTCSSLGKVTHSSSYSLTHSASLSLSLFPVLTLTLCYLHQPLRQPSQLKELASLVFIPDVPAHGSIFLISLREWRLYGDSLRGICEERTHKGCRDWPLKGRFRPKDAEINLKFSTVVLCRTSNLLFHFMHLKPLSPPFLQSTYMTVFILKFVLEVHLRCSSAIVILPECQWRRGWRFWAHKTCVAFLKMQNYRPKQHNRELDNRSDVLQTLATPPCCYCHKSLQATFSLEFHFWRMSVLLSAHERALNPVYLQESKTPHLTKWCVDARRISNWVNYPFKFRM